MKRITTIHGVVGYAENVAIVERALREQFGISDDSGVMVALAQHIWSVICMKGGDEREWGTEEIQAALRVMQHRMTRINATVADASFTTHTSTNGVGR